MYSANTVLAFSYDLMVSQLGLKLTHFEDEPMHWPGDDAQYFHLAADSDEMETDSGRGRSLTTDGADTLRSGNKIPLLYSRQKSFITARLRSTTGGYIFTLSVHHWEGRGYQSPSHKTSTGHMSFMGEGYPSPR